MSADGPVDVHRQTIHAIIPWLDMKAAGRINKLRRLTIIGFSVVFGVGFGGYGIAYLSGQFNIVTATIVVTITMGVYYRSQHILCANGPKNGIKNFKDKTSF